MIVPLLLDEGVKDKSFTRILYLRQKVAGYEERYGYEYGRK